MDAINDALQNVAHTLATIDRHTKMSTRDIIALYEQAWGVMSLVRFLVHSHGVVLTQEQSDMYIGLEDIIFKGRDEAWAKLSRGG